MLTVTELLNILELLSRETVVEENEAFPYRVTRKGFGYSDDEATARLQGKLSIMLEVARKREHDRS